MLVDIRYNNEFCIDIVEKDPKFPFIEIQFNDILYYVVGIYLRI